MDDNNNNNKNVILARPAQALRILFGIDDIGIKKLKGQAPLTDKPGTIDDIDKRSPKNFLGYNDGTALDRVSKYREYDRMDVLSPEIHTALDIYAEEASQNDNKTGLKVWVDSEKDNVAEELNGMLQRIRQDKKVYGHYRNLAKYGDVFMYLNLGGYGIHDTFYIHPSRLERIQSDGLLGFKSQDLAQLIPMDNKEGLFKPWDFVHMTCGAYDNESIYGSSFLDALRKAWNNQAQLECYDSTTEILTKERGWILFKDLIGYEHVATRNPATKAFEWQIPSDVITKEHNGEMVYIKGRAIDLLVTPNHRILLNKKPKKVVGPIEEQPNGEVVVTAQELINKSKYEFKLGIPTSISNWEGIEIKEKVFSNIPNNVKSERNGIKMEFITKGSCERIIKGDDFCALMGMYLSEGCIDKSGGIKIAQQEKSKGYLSFKDALKNINSGEDVVHDGHFFNLHWKALNPYFSQFGYAYEKFIPDEIMNATTKQLQIFFDYFVLGDGSFYPGTKKTKSISTTSKKMAGQLVEIAQKLGLSANIITREAHTSFSKLRNKEVNCRESYHIGIKYNDVNTITKAEFQQYSGTVHCVKVPNTIVYVRRNGKASWAGNTMIVLYRISKAVQRNVFEVDTGQSSTQEAMQIVKEYDKMLRNKTTFIDPITKQFKLDFNPATLLQDIIWPTRPGSNSKITQLKSDGNLGSLEDLEYWKNKMRMGLGIPKDYFDGEYSGTWNSKEALMLQDVRFGRKIAKLQDGLREGMVRLCQIHWAITHQEFLDPSAFVVNLGSISDSAERGREEVLLRKAQVLEILANVSIVLGWNRWAWSDYLLDEVFPLPAKLRQKFYTPDPKEEMDQEAELEITKAAAVGKAKAAGGASKPKAKTKPKPTKKATPDSIRRGLSKFGGKESIEDIYEEFPIALEEIKEIEEYVEEIVNKTKPNTQHGFKKGEIEELIKMYSQSAPISLNESAEEQDKNLVKAMRKIDLIKLNEMSRPPDFAE